MDGNSNDSVAANHGTDTSVTYSAGNGIINQGGGYLAGSSSNSAVTAVGLPATDTARTINLWVKCTTTVGDGCFGWGSVAGTGEKCMILISAGNAYFAGHSADLNSNTAVNDGNWHMITFKSAGGTNGAVAIFTDGVSRNTGTLTLNTSNQVTRWGVRTDDTSHSTIAIDEIGVWSRAISDAEITELYNNGGGLTYPFTSSAKKNLTLLGVG